MFPELKDKCGIFGICEHPEAANLTYLGLHALQHRGQESAGIVSSDGENLYSHRQMGLVADIFNDEIINTLKGKSAIGHTRYSTTGESRLSNAQPFLVNYSRGGIAIAHNGNLVNAGILRDELEARGSIFQSTMDTEVIVHLVAISRKKTLSDRIIEALSRVEGAYSLLFLTENGMVAARDSHGFRPLILGKLKGSYLVASETCALDLIDAEYIRDIEPGEIIIINGEGLNSYKPFPSRKKFCVFELIYFSRPDSQVFGRDVYAVRREMGRQLAREYPAEVDMVIPVPDSGVSAALGFAEGMGVPFEMGMVRNHYVGRTFIEPRQSIRHFGVKIKLNSLKKYFRGKKVAIVDDSLVRGTTTRKIVTMVRNCGARTIHVRISSPPVSFPCYYGIDIPTKSELIASSLSVKEINKYITSDTLAYLSLEGLMKSVNNEKDEFCNACFTGRYPIKSSEEKSSWQLPLF